MSDSIKGRIQRVGTRLKNSAENDRLPSTMRESMKVAVAELDAVLADFNDLDNTIIERYQKVVSGSMVELSEEAALAIWEWIRSTPSLNSVMNNHFAGVVSPEGYVKVDALAVPKQHAVPHGVHWTGIEGDEIQRADFPEDPDEGDYGKINPIYEGDLEAALAVAEKCNLPFLVCAIDTNRDNPEPWSLHAYSSRDKGLAWVASLSSSDDSDFPWKYLICDTRIEEFVEAPIGYSAVRTKETSDA